MRVEHFDGVVIGSSGKNNVIRHFFPSQQSIYVSLNNPHQNTFQITQTRPPNPHKTTNKQHKKKHKKKSVLGTQGAPLPLSRIRGDGGGGRKGTTCLSYKR